MQSCVLILPKDQIATGNAVGEAMGWGPNNYSVALSADGLEPITYWGLHTWADDTFQQMVETGYYPPQVEAAGITKADYDDMLAVLISSFWNGDTGHFETICANNGLQLIAWT